MKNLKSLDRIKYKLNSLQNGTHVLSNPRKPDELYFRSDSEIVLFDGGGPDPPVEQVLLRDSPSIVDWEFLALNNELCIAKADGEVTIINFSNVNSEEVVTFCEGGIERMSWSPDQEVVVFVTAAKTVVVMDCTYDPITETTLESGTFGDQEFITVGWGKKETQFHGSEGKQAARQTTDLVRPDNIAQLDTTVSITWRGDGEYFAISFLADYGRTFKVFNKEGQLQFTSEKLNGLGATVAWKPSGAWIAVPHVLPNKYTIALFEKNGLKHREIVLPFKFDDEPIVSLSWSSDSDILAVETLQGAKSNVYLYTMSNYHWYMKQALNFGEKITNLHWDMEMNEPKTLHVVLQDGSYLKYRWTFQITTSIGNKLTNLCIVGVIDGKKLLLTDFRNNTIPPPMSKCSLESNSNINEAGFINDPDNPQKLFVLTSDHKFITYESETQCLRGAQNLKGMKLLKEYDFIYGVSHLPLNYKHWIWLNENEVVFCESNGNLSEIFLYNLNSGLKSNWPIQGQIISTTSISSTEFFVHLIDGKVFKFNVLTGILVEPVLFTTFPEYCERLQAVQVNETTKLFALKDNQNFYINNMKIASDVTSYFIGEHYFVFTHLNSMKFMRLEDEVVVSERRMERGGKLIVIVPKDSQTVIQMPRGNLEMIQPRVLSLRIIGELLDESQYEKAMVLLRKQRINLNILFDHNPNQFLSEINNFLSQISNPQWLNLFLTELQNEDFTQKMYASNYEQNRMDYPNGYSVENKINYVCDQICSTMKSLNDDNYILPIITCFVKKGELESALALIWEQKKREVSSNRPSQSEDSLRYLLYMADVNELYKIALGMYDFGLVLFVANKSQKDPKEFIPFLNELKKLDENYRKFKIDDYLKRYEKAFENLANCDSERFSECLEYIQKHNLYTIALKRFEVEGGERYKQISLIFADHLRTSGKIENASIMYERGGDFKQAVMSAKHVLDVERCLMLTKLAGCDEDEVKVIALSLVPALQANSRCDDAFNLVKTYGSDFAHAICILLEGRHYLRAIFEARMKAVDLIETLVKPHLESYALELSATIQSDTIRFLKYTNRLAAVRICRAKKDLEEEDADESDLISDTTSFASKYTGTSRGTGKTFRSSKNRRKHERKLLNLKEGNKFEDIALIDVLHKTVQNVYEQQVKIHSICKALIEVKVDREARIIQKLYGELLDTIKEKLDEIWIPEMMIAQQMIGPNIDYAQLQNDQHYAMIPPHQRYKPQLNIIEWQHAILQ